MNPIPRWMVICLSSEDVSEVEEVWCFRDDEADDMQLFIDSLRGKFDDAGHDGKYPIEVFENIDDFVAANDEPGTTVQDMRRLLAQNIALLKSQIHYLPGEEPTS